VLLAERTWLPFERCVNGTDRGGVDGFSCSRLSRPYVKSVILEGSVEFLDQQNDRHSCRTF